MAKLLSVKGVSTFESGRGHGGVAYGEGLRGGTGGGREGGCPRSNSVYFGKEIHCVS